MNPADTGGGGIEVIPGAEQHRMAAATSAAIHALIQRNDQLTHALSEVLMHLDCANVLEAKRTAQQALHDL